MNVITCETCQHWQPLTGPYDHALRPGWGMCRLTEASGSRFDNEQADPRAIAVDQESFSAWLETAPNFGCVQHARRADLPKLQPIEIIHEPRTIRVPHCSTCGSTDVVDCAEDGTCHCRTCSCRRGFEMLAPKE